MFKNHLLKKRKKYKRLAQKKVKLHTEKLSFIILLSIKATLTINLYFLMQNK